ncbi:MAG: type I-U CRISPR-associated RAMP protein Csb1/Cas7u [Chloroflexi bacterium]|nr:type I-U CRISPR-associated RAMP protein Csb1/Cas7u [Chloroflexota bacterium]MCY3587811.1 type I-U CRISPR-associated RAMP protein Csb1/Cas7u [Chloroflexota bacterium]MCY3696024.1 type I-U CRISPR-associated RAMP protein Csb1/Cas7u [Chloroflexota bacterium]MDE2707329.1 type I-U CRISPR-associated RAMP protein Csb1/Cas7u [Chloroflexota bacterium]MYD74927.1 type I-U CRISPR-associated protein Cas7 [Chloroflexota bacterium]
MLDLERLLVGCADTGFDDGIRIEAELLPISGPGGPVKPAVYEGGSYQLDRRWDAPSDQEPVQVVVVDNVPSQANRLEHALWSDRQLNGIPEFILDLSELSGMPAHLPRSISSLKFPHRNADAYLRDATVDGQPFFATDLGQAIFAATAQECGPLMSWFPQALLFGFWQSHLGRKRHNTKHARAWVSEIIGWQPASIETRGLGLKGDPLNLNTDDLVTSNPEDRTKWGIGKAGRIEGGRRDRLSEMGHGQVPFMGEDAAAAAVSFRRVTQRATVSFAQLRRVSLGREASEEADAAARALLVALGLHAHQLAFGRAFALRSAADLRPSARTVTWLGGSDDQECDLGGADATRALLADCREHAALVGVPLEGWNQPAIILHPGDALAKAIRLTWPELDN